jgi:SRSO17 transposase
VDFDLFLPQAWAEDGERCRKAKVPDERQVHRTKAELALELVERARARGLEYQWIGGDEIYGNNQVLCGALEDAGEVFLMDVASNLQVWEENPRPAFPAASRGTKGRPPTRAATTVEGLAARKVAELSAACFEKECRWVTLRETTKGPLRVQLLVKEVWLWGKDMAEPRRRLLVVRREADGSHKYSLTNASADLSWERLGFMQAQRFFIERAFQDAKSQLGMAQYEVRGWRGWYHHMTMCCLALLFCLKERVAYAQELPLLSVRDIVELLDFYLPRRDRDLQHILANLHARHEARASAIKHARQRAKIVTK